MKNLFSIFILTILLSSCKSDNQIQTVRIGNQYTIELPSFLSKTDKLNKNASLQYQNTDKEYYVIVIEENKEGFKEAINRNNMGDPNLNKYAHFLIENLKASISVTAVSTFEEKVINSLNTITTTITAPISKNNFYWKFAFIEGKNNFYQVIVWTLKNQEPEYNEKMDLIIHSFREINKK